MPGFSSLRIIPFEPQFHHSPDLETCADHINRPHRDDYPRYVNSTAAALTARLNHPWPDPGWPDNASLLALHRAIFQGDKPSAWRTANVMVNMHKAPDWNLVPRYMDELQAIYANIPATPERIREWYIDFQTIHPFLDGNGRVGGCVVALVTRHRNPSETNLLTPGV